MDFIKDKRTHFAPDSPRGGGNDDGDNNPWDTDREMAKIFKKALLANMPEPSNTKDIEALRIMAKLLQDRLNNVCNNLVLIAPELRGIAVNVNKIPKAADRLDPNMLVMRFRNFDLHL